MSTFQHQRTNPSKPSVVKRHGVWLARVVDPIEGHLVDGAESLPEAYRKALAMAEKVAAA